MNASKPIEEFLLVALNLPSLKLTAKAPENRGKEDDPFLFGMAYFQVRLLLVSVRVYH